MWARLIAPQDCAVGRHSWYEEAPHERADPGLAGDGVRAVRLSPSPGRVRGASRPLVHEHEWFPRIFRARLRIRAWDLRGPARRGLVLRVRPEFDSHGALLARGPDAGHTPERFEALLSLPLRRRMGVARRALRCGRRAATSRRRGAEVVAATARDR